MAINCRPSAMNFSPVARCCSLFLTRSSPFWTSVSPLARRSAVSALVGCFLPVARRFKITARTSTHSTAQGSQHNWLDQGFDVLATGVVGAELGAFGGIKSTLKKGPENGCVHGIPFELRGFIDGVDLVSRELQRRRVGEKIAVEVADFIDAELTAVGHALEQSSHHLLQDCRLIAVPDDHLGEKLWRQQSDVLGEKAEDHPVEKLGDRVRVDAALPQALGDVAKAGGGLLGDGAVGCARPELVWLEEKASQYLETADRTYLAQRNPMHFRRRACEIGMDFKVAGVACDEQRRIVEGFAVLQELFVGLGKIGVRALVFESEEAAFPDIGPAVAAALSGRAFSKAKSSPVASSSAGLGWPTSSQRSRKCCW